MRTSRASLLLAGTALSIVPGLQSSFAQQSQLQLPPVTVEADRDGISTTTAGPVRGYQALGASSATRTNTPIEQIPQAIQVVPRRLIDDQGATTQSEALRNVSGVVPADQTFFGQVYPMVRGFNADRVVDGLPNYYDGGGRDLLVNVERIEVLKGPSAILYPGAASTISGVVNVVSKMPVADQFFHTGITVGGYDYWSPFFDFNIPIAQDGTVLFRMTGQLENTRGPMNVYRRQSYTLNPTVTFTNKDTTSLTIQLNLSRRDLQDYAGLPAMGTLDRSAFSIARGLWTSSTTTPRASTRNQSVTVRLDHKFNDVWSTFSTARFGSSSFNEPGQFSFPGNTPTPFFGGSNFGYFNGLLRENTTQISFNTNLLATIDAGPSKNKFLISADFDRVTDEGKLGFGLAGVVDLAAVNPVFPVYTQPALGTDARNTYTTFGATAQWQSTLWDRLHVLAALRVAKVQNDNKDMVGLTATGNSTTKFLPRLGAAFEVVKGVTVFGSYAEGLRPVPVFSGTALKPEHSRQFETGVKLNVATNLSATFALFHLTRENVAVPDPANPFLQIQTGEQRSRGFEMDVIWQPVRGLSLIANYAFTDAVVTKDTAVATGTPLAFVPRHAGRLWSNYRFTDGPLENLSLGGGMLAQSGARLGLSEAFATAGFVTFDAKIAYEYKNWTVSLVGKNLADRRYFVAYPYLSGKVAPADGRTAYFTVAAKF